MLSNGQRILLFWLFSFLQGTLFGVGGFRFTRITCNDKIRTRVFDQKLSRIRIFSSTDRWNFSEFTEREATICFCALMWRGYFTVSTLTPIYQFHIPQQINPNLMNLLIFISRSSGFKVWKIGVHLNNFIIATMLLWYLNL